MRKYTKRIFIIIAFICVVCFLALCALVISFHFSGREPTQWAKAYEEIKVGMMTAQVVEIIEPLPSVRCSHWQGQGNINPAKLKAGDKLSSKELKGMATLCLSYDAEKGNLWNYRVYFNKHGKVFAKQRWWD